MDEDRIREEEREIAKLEEGIRKLSEVLKVEVRLPVTLEYRIEDLIKEMKIWLDRHRSKLKQLLLESEGEPKKKIKEERKSVRERLRRVENETAKLGGEIETLSDRRDEYRMEIGKLHAVREELENSKKRLHKKIEETEKRLAELESERRELQDRFEDKRQELSKLKDKRNALMNQFREG